MKMALTAIILLMVVSMATTETTSCPSIPKGCICSHKKKGFRIKCESLVSVSFKSLPANVSFDIDMTSNMLKSLNGSMFPNPNNIRKLQLSDNEITKIEPGTFLGFKSLKRLDLSRNYLFELKDGTFSGLENFTMNSLNLQENRILSISAKAFKGLVIDKLYLAKQQKVENNKADLIAYADDFLSKVAVRSIDMSDNNLLCDCNLEWLVNWANRDGNVLTPETTCRFPQPVQGTFVKELKKVWNDQGCGRFRNSFTLPFFQLYPANNQVIFENDSAYIICQSTWTSQSFVVWYRNGDELSPENLPSNITMQHQTDLQLGIYVSMLKVNRFEGNYNNITCKLHVYGSGLLTATLHLETIKKNMSLCTPLVERTDQGYLSWPTTYFNTVARIPCPYGGIQNRMASRTCDNGNWRTSNVDQCFFSSNITKTLQDFYSITESRIISRIQNMAPVFKVFFRGNILKIRSRYDLYFIYKILHEIMLAYQDRRGTEYSGFFWSSLGLIARKHLHLPTMQHLLYGMPANLRFQSLLEAHVEQEYKKLNSKYVIDDHKIMAAFSDRISNGNILHCYITSPYKQRNGNLTASCVKRQNRTLDKISDVILEFSSFEKTIQATFIAFISNTFFQYKTKNKKHVLSSPVVGVNIGEVINGVTYHNFSKPILLTFQSRKEHHKPKLMYWSFKHNSSGEWLKTDDIDNKCKMLSKAKKDLTTQYRCSFKWQKNLTYLALFTEKQPPIVYVAQFLDVVIYVGACISAMFLLITFLIYAAFRSIRFNRGDTSALLNLCAILIIAELIFAFGIHRTDFPFLCQMVAIGLHYLLLAALIWLGCGATILIILLRKKDRIEIRVMDPIVKYYLIAWGAPIIIVGITIAFDPHNYGTQHYCWLDPDLSLGGFIAPGCFIMLIDLILVCYVHALTNKCYPDLPTDDIDSDENEENPDPNKCNNKICKYKVRPKNIYEKSFPKKDDLLLYIRASLSFILWISLLFTLMVMMFTYRKENTAVYLYYLFTYSSAACNLLLGFSLFWFHCYRRKDVREVVANATCSCQQKETKDTDDTKETLLKANDEVDCAEGPPHSPAISLRPPSHIEHREPSIIDQRSDLIEATSGVFGMSDQFQSDGSHIHSNGHVHVARAQVIDEEIPENSLVSDTVHQNQTDLRSQTDCSENEKQSVGKENSIGECSLTSSRNRQRVRPNNPDIPESLKPFVPENWRPAQRRRKPKQASYYPYFMSDLTPKHASLAYSSNTSSVNSTTVGGLPLYINKKQTANNLAMYNELFNPNLNPHNRLAPIRQQSFNQNSSHIPQNITPNNNHHLMSQPIPMGVLPFVDYRSGYATSDGSATNRSDIIGVEPGNEFRDIPETLQEVDEESNLVTGDENCEEEETEPIIVAPVLYIPIPHLTKKQFFVRNETSV